MGASTILAIDPGPERSAWVEYARGKVVGMGLDSNWQTIAIVKGSCGVARLAVEMVACYGMPVGSEVFETCVWAGRFVEAFDTQCHDHAKYYVYRTDVKMHLCGNTRAKDSNVRQALIDKFGPGKEKAIGKKATPGPLYGVKKDIWAALAVAVTFDETRRSHD